MGLGVGVGVGVGVGACVGVGVGICIGLGLWRSLVVSFGGYACLYSCLSLAFFRDRFFVSDMFSLSFFTGGSLSSESSSSLARVANRLLDVALLVKV